MGNTYRKYRIFCLFVILLSGLYGIYTLFDTDIFKVRRFYAWYYVTGQQFGNIFILSAVAKLYKSKTGYTGIVLNVWDNSINKDFYCCLKYDSHFSIVKAVRKTIFEFNTPILASQYECDVSNHSLYPGQVGITELDSRDLVELQHEHRTHGISTSRKHYGHCNDIDIKFYEIYYPKKNEGKLALCPKIAYDKIHPIKLIEWFEYQKMMGVTKVIVSVQYLNADALRVLEYYRKQGLVEIVPYPEEIPGDVYGFKDRGFEVNRRIFPQFSHDEQVAVYHCFSRLQGYEYVSVMDFDEFLVSSKDQTTLELMKELTALYPKAAGFTFYTSFYLTDNANMYNGTLTSSYVIKVGPRMECQKNVYIPNRTTMVSTHVVDPSDYFSTQTVPMEIAVLNHYRNCPGQKHWKNNCREVRKTKDTTMFRYTEELDNRIKKVKRIIKGIDK